MNSGEIFKEDIVDVVNSIIAKTTYTGGARLVAGYILHINVGRVAFNGYAILQYYCQDMFEKTRRGQSSYIAAFNNPILDDDILGVPRVKTISIDGIPLRCRGGIHIEVGHRHIFRVCNERVPWGVSVAYGCCGESSPKLRLSPRDTIDKDVLRFPKSKADGTAGHV